MSTTTPRPSSRHRSNSRPTTPLRRSSRSHPAPSTDHDFPLNSLTPAFAELSDSTAILSDNLSDLAAMHDSLSRFNESFSAFLYGLNMNAFCVDFPEAPLAESFRRTAEREERAGGGWDGEAGGGGGHDGGYEGDGGTTFMTTDTSFVNEPVTGKREAGTPLKTPARRQPAGRGRGRASGSGLPRGRGMGRS